MSDKDKINKKPKGPIRTGAVVPFIMFVVLVSVFNIFFLDMTIKKTIEFIGTKANGAQVDVGSVDTSISDLRAVVTNIEFTNPDKPMQNNFVIGKLTFQALWDGILRAKLVINEAKLEDIRVRTKRTSKGYVVPKDEAAASATKEVLDKTKKEFEGNILGDVAALLSGSGVAKGMRVEDNLKSKKRYDELSLEVDSRSKEISKTFKDLPNKDDLESLKRRFNKIKWNDIGNLAKAPKVLKEIDDLRKDVDKTKRKFEKANKLVNKNIKFIQNGQKGIKNLIKEDMASVQKRMNLPSMDTKTIAKLLFGNQVLEKIEMAEGYYAKIKKYLPPKKTKEEKIAKKPDYTQHARGKGRDYQFGIPKSYPPIWIQKVVIDSKNDQGDVRGEILDITTNQRIINKPTLLKINGDFLSKGLVGVVIKGLFDHRTEARDSVDFTVGSYPVNNKALSKSKTAKLVIDKARGNMVANISFINDVLNFKMKNYYKEIKYDHGAKDKIMAEVLARIAKDTKTISMEATAKGKIKSLKWDIRTNLAKAIQSSVNNLIKEKIAQAKKKIENEINKAIGGSKKEFESKLAGFKKQYQSQLDQGKKQFDSFKKDIDKRKKKEEKKGRKSLENEAKKLFKGIKF